MKKRYINKLFIILVLGLTILPFNVYAKSIFKKPLLDVITVNNSKISVEIADTEEKRHTGFMFRKDIPDNSGMIFLFEKPQHVNFWMKNVKNPLDILFIYNDKVVKIYNMVPVCNKEPCELYPSGAKINYVIELKGGFCQKNSIKEGQNVTLNSNIRKKLESIQQ